VNLFDKVFFNFYIIFYYNVGVEVFMSLINLLLCVSKKYFREMNLFCYIKTKIKRKID